MIWIITAMSQEAEHIINLYKLQPTKTFKNIKIFENNKIVLVLAGIWKIQASLGASILCQNYKLEKIINIWIAGFTWKNPKAKIWDVFLVNEVLQHDGYLPFDWNHLDYFKKSIKLQTPKIEINFNFNIFEWVCATWDQFIDDKNKVEEIKNKFNADLVEMEAFATASVCREFDILEKLIIIKSISDDGSKQAITDHEKNLDLAMKNSIEVLREII